ncbi:GDP-fucose protein O-fucosyltransferase 3-like [Saccoglossus kowalevskii]|uniref:Fucosyltransferase n=1 Tax=Saccoglossus kowalevskii TaxID=10224 RepID=A0ABM0GY86_SACKO|nr:PREDICTED: alpha-(1,3)-fucosyltransferase 10-like [Saccoglossus kowalevskii]
MEYEFWIEDVDYGGQLIRQNFDKHDNLGIDASKVNVQFPILLWWTGFTGERGRVKTCGLDKCFFTVDRHYSEHPKTKVFMFYGTDFKSNDLPLPRQPHHEWALLHEESPKNNYKLTQPECLSLFNHTSTFKRESDFPITTQYLRDLSDLTSTEYMVKTSEKSKNGLAPVVYVQSDCDPPSDRDSYVKELMKYIKIDSYGKCLHNKNLPEELVDPLTMDNQQFYAILAKYKFHISFENAICNDYITEKLWRSFKIGTVPIYRGSPNIKDWLPSKTSALVADDYSSPRELAKYIDYLNENDSEYDKYLEYKKTGITNSNLLSVMKKRNWGVNDYTKMNFIDAFECFVCNQVHRNNEASLKGVEKQISISKADHYDCPRPRYFNDGYTNRYIDMYQHIYDQGRYEAMALNYFIQARMNFTKSELREYALQLRRNEKKL